MLEVVKAIKLLAILLLNLKSFDIQDVIEIRMFFAVLACTVVFLSRYAKVLVQEMNVKLDKSFILALASLLSKPPESYDEVCNVDRWAERALAFWIACFNHLVDCFID